MCYAFICTYNLCDIDTMYNSVLFNYLPITLKSLNHKQLLFIDRLRTHSHILYLSSITWKSRNYES